MYSVLESQNPFIIKNVLTYAECFYGFDSLVGILK
jgi:hypothetical protein